MSHYQDKVAIVTGGASGIGRALCEELAQRGAEVFVADINLTGAKQVASSIIAGGYRAHAVEVDVAQSEAVDNLVANALGEYGHLDFMFNNAGISQVGEIRDMELSDWQHILNINLWGVIHGTSSAYKVMVAQGSGHIVNTASGLGLCPAPMSVPYTATKHAVVGLSTALRFESADLGIKVSVVCPGFIRTHIFDTTTYFKINRKAAIAQSESFRMMEPADCARVILRAVSRNQAIIPVPLSAHVTWWLYRMFPTLYDSIFRMLAKQYRKSLRLG